jgi:chromate transporter
MRSPSTPEPPTRREPGARHLPAGSPAPNAPSILALFLTFLRLGAISFGGGLSAWAYREVVQKKGWMGEEEFMAGLAVSQILPGANITNMAVYIGNRLRGVVGSISALLGLLSVPFFGVIALLLIYTRVSASPWIQAALDGVASAAVGLTIMLGITAGRRMSRNLTGFAMLVATFVSVGVLNLPLIPVVLCLTPISIAAAWFGSKPNAQ